MATHLFRARPGIFRGTDAPVNPLANIRMAMEPPGALGDFIGSLTGSYSAFQKARICQTWLDLHDPSLNLVSRLDAFSVMMANEADSLRNWIEGKPDAVNHGATFGAGGFTLDGVDDYIETGVDPDAGGTLFEIDGASAGISVTDASTLENGDVVLGRSGGGAANIRISPYLTSGAAARFSINTTSVLDGVYSGAREGVWIINRTPGLGIRATRNGSHIANNPDYVVTAVPTMISIGIQGTNFAAFKSGGWFVGNGLLQSRERALADLVNAHVAAFVGN